MNFDEFDDDTGIFILGDEVDVYELRYTIRRYDDYQIVRSDKYQEESYDFTVEVTDEYFQDMASESIQYQPLVFTAPIASAIRQRALRLNKAQLASDRRNEIAETNNIKYINEEKLDRSFSYWGRFDDGDKKINLDNDQDPVLTSNAYSSFSFGVDYNFGDLLVGVLSSSHTSNINFKATTDIATTDSKVTLRTISPYFAYLSGNLDSGVFCLRVQEYHQPKLLVQRLLILRWAI